jgi:hypothetical protein
VRGENEHGHRAAGLAPFAQYVDAAHGWESDVEHDHVEFGSIAEEVTLLAVRRHFYDVTSALKGAPNLLAQARIVLND